MIVMNGDNGHRLPIRGRDGGRGHAGAAACAHEFRDEVADGGDDELGGSMCRHRR